MGVKWIGSDRVRFVQRMHKDGIGETTKRDTMLAIFKLCIEV